MGPPGRLETPRAKPPEPEPPRRTCRARGQLQRSCSPSPCTPIRTPPLRQERRETWSYLLQWLPETKLPFWWDCDAIVPPYTPYTHHLSSIRSRPFRLGRGNRAWSEGTPVAGRKLRDDDLRDRPVVDADPDAQPPVERILHARVGERPGDPGISPRFAAACRGPSPSCRSAVRWSSRRCPGAGWGPPAPRSRGR